MRSIDTVRYLRISLYRLLLEYDTMKTPSIKTLTRVFDNPHEARRVLKMKHVELSDHPVGAARILECMHSPNGSQWR